jgi:ribosomal-protein-serine acetyltransferase
VEPPRYFGLWDHGDLVGGAVYRTFDIQAGLCEVGGWLAPRAQAQGLITLAFRQMIAWAFDTHSMRRLELRVSPGNIRARRIAERLGMTREALLPNAFALNGRHYDSEVWTLVASDQPIKSSNFT